MKLATCGYTAGWHRYSWLDLETYSEQWRNFRPNFFKVEPDNYSDLTLLYIFPYIFSNNYIDIKSQRNFHALIAIFALYKPAQVEFRTYRKGGLF